MHHSHPRGALPVTGLRERSPNNISTRTLVKTWSASSTDNHSPLPAHGWMRFVLILFIDYTADWHWVTIQDNQTYVQSLKNPNGDVVATIERIIADLKAKKLSGKAEQEAVKMLIHLIGDIHQPLHVGGGNDRGGNDIKVTWFRNDSNLHRVWDSDMIDDTKLSYTELAESLSKPDAKDARKSSEKFCERLG